MSSKNGFEKCPVKYSTTPPQFLRRGFSFGSGANLSAKADKRRNPRAAGAESVRKPPFGSGGSAEPTPFWARNFKTPCKSIFRSISGSGISNPSSLTIIGQLSKGFIMLPVQGSPKCPFFSRLAGSGELNRSIEPQVRFVYICSKIYLSI
jgi:hypothetical protein